jgi:hypothetical protein
VIVSLKKLNFTDRRRADFLSSIRFALNLFKGQVARVDGLPMGLGAAPRESSPTPPMHHREYSIRFASDDEEFHINNS